MGAAAHIQGKPAGPTYLRRQPEKTALYQVMQHHLLTFEQQWTDEASGGTLPKFVLDELHGAPRTWWTTSCPTFRFGNS